MLSFSKHLYLLYLVMTNIGNNDKEIENDIKKLSSVLEDKTEGEQKRK